MACVNGNTGKIIYMDNAATTRLCDEAFEAMLPYLKEDYANPAGVYDFSQNVAAAVAEARSEIAATINARPNEIYFTSGGTEADNWAVRGVVELKAGGSGGCGFYANHNSDYVNQGEKRLPHIVTTSFEHHAVLNTCRYLEKQGLARVSYVNPNASGMISPDDIEKQICKDTVLISVMFVNNELGTVQRIKDIGKMAHDHGILFHTDAVAAYGHLPIDVRELNADLISVSAHKFGGPKGVGFLFVNEALKLKPFMHGGYQEQGRRAGTLNVPGIIGMAAAAKLRCRDIEEDLAKRRALDDHFLRKLEEVGSGPVSSDGCGTTGNRPVFCINGPLRCFGVDEGTGVTDTDEGTTGIGTEWVRLPGHFNITIPGVNAEELIVKLGMKGICVSTGAACASSQDTASHVLKAIGLKGDALGSTIRISMNETNTVADIDTLFESLALPSRGRSRSGVTLV